MKCILQRKPTAADYKSGVYSFLNVTNGNRYIGSAVNFNVRRNEHLRSLRRGTHHSIPLQRAYLKYGEEALLFEKLIICERVDLVMYEQRCIDAFAPQYNVCQTAGSSLGTRHTEETKAQMSVARLGSKRSAETRARMSKALLGNKRNLGHKATPEHRAKIARSKIGKPLSLAHRQKLSDAKKGKTLSTEHRAKMRLARLRFLRKAKP